MLTTVQLLYEPKRRKPWVVRWHGEPDAETGRQRRHGRAFQYKRDAAAFQAEKQHEVANEGPRDRAEDVTLQRLIREFEDARLATLSHASREGYRHTLRLLIDHFGKLRSVRSIPLRQGEAFIAACKRTDGRAGDLAPWSRLRHIIHCRALFNAARAWGYVEHNPFSAPNGQGSSPLRVKPKSKPWHHLTPFEFHRLLAEVRSPQERAAIWLMYGCGLRPGEAYNMTAGNVDLEHGRVHVVNRAASRDVPPFTIKADGQSSESKERTVPISEAALPDLAKAMELSFRSGGFLVLTPKRFDRVPEHWRLCRAGERWGGHAWRPWQNRDMINNLLRNTKSALARAGIELTAPFNLQTLRKSFAQNHADAGTPPRTLAKLLGHSNTRVTMQYYNRVTDANERAAAIAMNRLLEPQSSRSAIRSPLQADV